MRTILVGLALLASCAAAGAKDLVYEGTWVTTNRKLDGTMTCVVTDLGGNRWHGHFSGVWSGQRFSYEVDFSGPADKLRGQAVIDGADYEWTGEMDREFPGSFTGSFWGSRYTGHFNLKRKDG
jgi:hypothetical protein